MIQVVSTPNEAGVSVLGDFEDIEGLYEALHEVVGDEGELERYSGARLRVLGVCYDLYKIEVLWPELLFVVMVLNDFKWFYAKRRSKSSYTPLTEWRSLWDSSVSQVRMFQSAVAKCLRETLSEASYARVVKQMNRPYPWVEGYITQYIDVLNL